MAHGSCWMCKQFQSLNVISCSDRTTADTLNEEKEINEWARERKGRTEKRQVRNTGAKKHTRNQESSKDLTRKTRQNANYPLKNKGITSQSVKKRFLQQEDGGEHERSMNTLDADEFVEVELEQCDEDTQVLSDFKGPNSETIHEAPVQHVFQVKDTIQHRSSGRPEYKDHSDTPKPSSVFVVICNDLREDSSNLEKMFRSMPRGFTGDGADEVSRCVRKILEPLKPWVFDMEEGNVLCTGQMQNKAAHDSDLPTGEELGTQDSAEGNKSAAEDGAACSVSIPDDSSGSICAVYEGVDNPLPGDDQDFIFINSYFAEPIQNRSGETEFLEVASDPKEQGMVGNLNATHRNRTSSMNSNVVGQSSAVRRLLEITADEIRAMVAMSLQDGRLVEDQCIHETPGLNIEAPEESSLTDMDSCEEVEEEVDEKAPFLHNHKTECKIS